MNFLLPLFSLILLVQFGFSAQGGLNMTGRGLIAVPQNDYKVFVSWRYLVQDGSNTGFDVYRSKSGEDFSKIGTALSKTVYNDTPGPGEFQYYIIPQGGNLRGQKSNSFKVNTLKTGHDWVSVFPGTQGKRLQLGNAHFADTDGDGELEFVTWNPSSNGFWPTPLKFGTFKVEVYKMFSGEGPKWSYDTQCGPSGTPYNHHTAFHPVAYDIDGDFKAEIITKIKNGNFAVLKDMGNIYQKMAEIPGSRWYNGFADLGGRYYAFLDIKEQIDAWEWDGKSAFIKKWTTNGPSSSDSHSQMIVDVDGDGIDEIANCYYVYNSDGKLRWSAQKSFGGGPGSVMEISDADPKNPGLEILMTNEADLKTRANFALLDAKTGKELWAKKSKVCGDVQVAFFSKVHDGAGLDVVAVDCGHEPEAGLGITSDGNYFNWPYEKEFPMISFDLGSIDWLGLEGYETRVLNRKIYGRNGKKLYTADLSDCSGCVVAEAPGSVSVKNDWLSSKAILRYWNNVDLIGDYREDLVFGMPDGSIRVYVNTTEPPAKKITKWQYPTYEKFQAISTRQGFAKALGEPIKANQSTKIVKQVFFKPLSRKHGLQFEIPVMLNGRYIEINKQH